MIVKIAYTINNEGNKAKSSARLLPTCQDYVDKTDSGCFLGPDALAQVGSVMRWLSGVNRGQREHRDSFTGYRTRKVLRCTLDSCLMLSSVFARSPPVNYPP